MTCTIDASVFVALARASDVHHIASFEFLRQVEAHAEDIYCPTLVLAECSAAIARQTDSSILAERIVSLVENFPNLHLVSLDISIARWAAQIAQTRRLRGADCVYVAVAEAFNATLVTWDGEMLQRASDVVPTFTPPGWMEQLRAEE